MTVKEFLQNYGGNECVSIEGYCEEEHYDYCSGGRNKNPPALAVGSVKAKCRQSPNLPPRINFVLLMHKSLPVPCRRSRINTKNKQVNPLPAGCEQKE